MQEKDVIFEIYKDSRSVFNLNDIAQILNETDNALLRQKIYYYVKTGRLNNIRKGIYVKDNFDIEELSCKIYKPSYISLETVLQKSGLIFQYYKKITLVSYLSRTIEIEANKGIELSFRKIKNNILLNTSGIVRNNNGINIASPERAFLDTLYLMKNFYFDNLSSLNKKKVKDLLKIYNSNSLNQRVYKILKNG